MSTEQNSSRMKTESVFFKLLTKFVIDQGLVEELSPRHLCWSLYEACIEVPKVNLGRENILFFISPGDVQSTIVGEKLN